MAIDLGPMTDIVWQPWKKKFAYLPMRMNRKKYIWLKTYYVRKGSKFMNLVKYPLFDITDRCETIFEVLQKD